MEIITAMGILLDSLNSELTADGTREDMCLVSVMPGSDVPLDYSLDDCGGMGWVRLVSAVPSVTFPAASTDSNNCNYTLAYEIEMGVFRRAPLPEGIGSSMTLPSADDHFESAQLAMKDLGAMHRALKSGGSHFEDYILGAFVPQGPQGGVVGGTWNAIIGLDF